MKQDGSAVVRREATDSASGNLDAPTSDQRALAILRRMIVDGSIVPGEKVTEVGIAALLDMSRTPVRLALTEQGVSAIVQLDIGTTSSFPINEPNFLVNSLTFGPSAKYPLFSVSLTYSSASGGINTLNNGTCFIPINLTLGHAIRHFQ